MNKWMSGVCTFRLDETSVYSEFTDGLSIRAIKRPYRNSNNNNVFI